MAGVWLTPTGLPRLSAYFAGENANHRKLDVSGQMNSTLPVVVRSALQLGTEDMFVPTTQVSLYIPDTQEIEFAPQPVCPHRAPPA